MDNYGLLRDDIRSKIKKKKLYGSDCNLLSQKIYNETQRQVSISTLKRFFGLIKNKHNPSKYTLDTLAEFVGFKDWSDYAKSHDTLSPTSFEDDPWEVLKRQMLEVTSHSLESLKQKTNYNKDEFIFRPLGKDRFDRFEATNIPATLFIAPDGYGKSSLMIQLVEKYFLTENEKFKNDIICLIDGGIFFNLYSKNSNIDMLNQLLEFNVNPGLNFYFHKNPEKRKGRIWLLFDDVDEVFFDRKRYLQLIENIMQILMVNDGGWFKAILTCRPENLDVFTQLFHKNPVLKATWFDVGFTYEKYIDAINIPLFSTKDIKMILKLQNVEPKYKGIFTRYKDVLGIISHPYSLSLFIREFKQNENISEIILLDRFIKAKIFSPPFLEEKILLMKRYIALCNRGKETTLVEKEHLVRDPDLIPAHQQLISDGILYEFIVPEDTIDLKIMVSFTQRIILDYMVLRAWTQDKNYSVELLLEIVEFYKNSKLMQGYIIKLFMKMLVQNNELELIKQICGKLVEFTQDKEGNQNVSECMDAIVATINEMGDNNEELHKLFQL
ncbi:hypothetical protein OU798_18945 [Prolixibacteraceae bacterium Z1-6]|uniref:NACHT domain-containing protein n=1 Tax=Draconibacterium aestuarii TaxID=2998507 RepID=A0A9X3F8D3_9BACT|nr:hypothetical protein [Prolixibacteraceae bacterium Z1-6]